MTSVTYQSLSPTALNNLSGWWDIYEHCFPSSEREPREVILKSLAEEVGMAFGAFHSDRIIGISTIHLLREPAAIFLVYISLADEWRGKGIGSSFMDFVLKEGQQKLEDQGLFYTGTVWEVDRPSDAVEDKEIHCRNQRIDFFKKNKGQVLPVNYIQPPVDGLQSVPMHLVFRPNVSSSFETDFYSDLIRAIYYEKYRKVNGIAGPVIDELFLNIITDK